MNVFAFTTPSACLITQLDIGPLSELSGRVHERWPVFSSSSLESAAVWLCDTELEASRLDPIVEVAENETLRLNQQLLLRVNAPTHTLNPNALSVPTTIFAMVIDANRLEAAELARIAAFDRDIGKILIVHDDPDFDLVVKHINIGTIDAVVRPKTHDATEVLDATLSRFRDKHFESRRQLLCKYIGLGHTSFLHDVDVLDLITNLVKERNPTSTFVSVEPPGILLVFPPPTPSQFVMICSQDYVKFLQELAELNAAASIHPDTLAGYRLLHEEHLTQLKPVGGKSYWYYLICPTI